MIICCLDLETSCHPRGSCWRERWRLETIINQKQKKNWERTKSIPILMLHLVIKQSSGFHWSLWQLILDKFYPHLKIKSFLVHGHNDSSKKIIFSFLCGSQHYSNFSFLFWGSHNRCRGYAVCTHQCSNIHSCSEGHKPKGGTGGGVAVPYQLSKLRSHLTQICLIKFRITT